MIWYNQEIHCLEQPEDIALYIVGLFDVNISTITIKLEIHRDKITSRILVSKTISSLGYSQEPNPDDINYKYCGKIAKYTKNAEKATFDSISKWGLKE